MIYSDGLRSFLEEKDFDPSGFCFKSSYQDLFREFSVLVVFDSFWLFLAGRLAGWLTGWLAGWPAGLTGGGAIWGGPPPSILTARGDLGGSKS